MCRGNFSDEFICIDDVNRNFNPVKTEFILKCKNQKIKYYRFGEKIFTGDDPKRTLFTLV